MAGLWGLPASGAVLYLHEGASWLGSQWKPLDSPRHPNCNAVVTGKKFSLILLMKQHHGANNIFISGNAARALVKILRHLRNTMLPQKLA